MHYPNSIANRVPYQGLAEPVPRRPGFQVPVPANDNPPFRIPKPANDNVRLPRPGAQTARPLRLPRLPGIGTAFGVGYAIGHALFSQSEEPELEVEWPGVTLIIEECPPAPDDIKNGTYWFRSGSGVACSPTAFASRQYIDDAVQVLPNGQWINAASGRIFNISRWDLSVEHPSLTNYFWREGYVQIRKSGLTSAPGLRVRLNPRSWAVLIPPVVPAISPDIFPDAMPVAVPVALPLHAPAPRPQNRPAQFPQGASSGQPQRPQPPRRPKRPKRPDKKVRLEMAEALVSLATEGMDAIAVMWNQLPLWERYRFMHKYGLSYANPYWQAVGVSEMWSSMNAGQAFFDILEMQLEDRWWAMASGGNLRPGSAGVETGIWDTYPSELVVEYLEANGIPVDFIGPNADFGDWSPQEIFATKTIEAQPNGEVR